MLPPGRKGKQPRRVDHRGAGSRFMLSQTKVADTFITGVKNPHCGAWLPKN
jgi:hypothetical protein